MALSPEVLLPSEGLPNGLGLCFAALEEVRAPLREAVEGMTDDAIARRAVPGAHAIAALLLHIGEAEWWWMRCVISGHVMNAEDERASFWDVLEDKGDFARHGYTARYCLDVIDSIRQQTRDVLASFGDEDLDRIFFHQRERGDIHISLRRVLHHLADHEAQHKGQILMLKRLLEQ